MAVLLAAGLVGARLEALNGGLPIFWPASGVGIWVIVRYGRGMWPAIAVAAVMIEIASAPLSLGATGVMVVGRTSEALVGAWVWRSVRDRWLGVFRDASACLAAALIAPLVTAGAAAIGAAGVESGSWIMRWTASAGGALATLPLLMGLPVGGRWRILLDAPQLARALGLLALLSGVTWLAFVHEGGGTYLFAVFPALLLALIWFGSFGARLAALLVSVAGISAELAGYGVSSATAAPLRLLHLHIFTASVCVTALVLPLYRHKTRMLLPMAVMVAGWLVSGWLYAILELNGRERRDEIFQDRVAAAEAAIRVRIASYLDAIRGGASFYMASKVVERDEWRAYIESVQVRTRYPGMNGLGIIFPVEPDGVDAWKARMQSIGYPNPSIRPFPGTRERVGATKYVVTLLEPVELNSGSIGRDIGTDPSRREAADLARDTGEPRISRRLPGSRDTQRRAGLLLYVPIYQKNAAISSVEERRRAHVGWVYAQFYPDTFLEGALGPMAESLSLHFFENRTLTREALLYSTDQPIHVDGSNPVLIGSGPLPEFERVTDLEMAGQPFLLGWKRGAKYVSAESTQLAWVGCSFTLATLLLSGLVLSLKSSGLQAQALVDVRTRELTVTQTRLRGVLDGAAFSIISTSPDGTIVTCNAGAESLLGYTRAELAGRLNLSKLHLPAELESREKEIGSARREREDAAFEALVSAARSGQSDEREWTYVRKDGGKVPVLVRLSALRDPAGALSGFLAIAQDLTGQKRTEGALRASERRLQHVLRQAECVVWEARVELTQGNWVWQTTVYDSGLFSRLCATGEPRVNAPPWQRFDIYEQREMDVRSRRAMESGEGGFTQEFRLRQEGGVTWLRESVAVTPTAPSTFWLVGVAIDITGQKEAEAAHKSLERQLRQSQKMEAIGTLAGGIAHDFNNILAGIFGFTALSRAEAAGNPVLEDYLDEIGRAGQRAAQLVRQILAFSRAQQVAGGTGPVSLSRILGEAGPLLRATSPATIELEFETAADLPAVEGDEIQLHQVVMNLATNAIYAMRNQGGRLTIRLDQYQVDEVTARSLSGLVAGAYIRLSVTDTGPGIDPAIQERLFEPFFTTKGPGEGSGLGLSVVHGIVRDHHGAIRLFSHPGQGATFEVLLPAAAEAESGDSASNPPPEEGKGSGERILFVEDEVTVSRACSLALERLGYAVKVESDGLEGLACFTRDPDAFDLVVTDQTMPGLTGLELATRIHAMRPGIPIIMASGHTAMLNSQATAAAGVCEVLAKPYSLDDLAKTVRRQLTRRQAV